MSNRKLQQEFDRANKKITEGLTVFDDIYDKLMTTDISSQKEKLESDLKKEIKKLQRLRDQLKTWIGDSSIKLDKSALRDNRTKIEHAMDQFKDLEKSSKIKQFSNEGLELQSQSSKYNRFTDPENAKKYEAVTYISGIIDRLNQQNEALELDLHQLTVLLKKSKSGNSFSIQASIDNCKHNLERNAHHLTKLELILRNLENENLDPDRIDEIKDDLEYYVENNQDEDYVEYDDFYDQLNMEESSLDVQGSLAHHSIPEKSESGSDDKVVKENEGKTDTPYEYQPEATELKIDQNDQNQIFAPEIRKVDSRIDSKIESDSDDVSNKKTKPAVSSSSVPPPTLSGANSYSDVIKAAQAMATKTSPSPSISSQKINTEDSRKYANIQADEEQFVNSHVFLNNTGKLISDSVNKLAAISHSRLQSPLPYQSISNLLESSLLNCPDSFDSEKPRQYIPSTVHPSSIDYPQEPMYELNSSHIMKKFDNDTLFFCFYYSDNSNPLAKWNAAQELSRRGWIFNKKSKQWFMKDSKNGSRSKSSSQSLDKKDLQAPELQEENYKYFDYEKTWLTRRKENFKFDLDFRQSF